MRYKCQLCDHQTNYRTQINEHHIKPKELGGCNKKWNLISLCPNCHNRIYISESKKGNHSIKCDNSIILIGWHNNLTILEYIDGEGNAQFKEKK